MVNSNTQRNNGVATSFPALSAEYSYGIADKKATSRYPRLCPYFNSQPILDQEILKPKIKERSTHMVELEESLYQQNDTVTHLHRPLLVGLNLQINDEVVKVYCDSREIGLNTIRITTPCQLGLRSGTRLKVDLFLPDYPEAICLNGRVSKVDRILSKDLIRFAIELEYTTTNSTDEHKISELIQKSIAENATFLPV
jgi:hypothetical protein